MPSEPVGMRLYHYVGPKEIAERVRAEQRGFAIRSPEDVRTWVRDSGQELSDGAVTATFVVDAAGLFLLADRHSEHVACAAGDPVRSAGEITLWIGAVIDVESVSNQSTGYCPEPESWKAVSDALTSAGLVSADQFDTACAFRRCMACREVTLVKDAHFECGLCGGELPAFYNVQ